MEDLKARRQRQTARDPYSTLEPGKHLIDGKRVNVKPDDYWDNFNANIDRINEMHRERQKAA